MYRTLSGHPSSELLQMQKMDAAENDAPPFHWEQWSSAGPCHDPVPQFNMKHTVLTFSAQGLSFLFIVCYNMIAIAHAPCPSDPLGLVRSSVIPLPASLTLSVPFCVECPASSTLELLTGTPSFRGRNCLDFNTAVTGERNLEGLACSLQLLPLFPSTSATQHP